MSWNGVKRPIMTIRFKTDLEQALADAHQKRMTEDAFLTKLKQAEVFLPVYEDPEAEVSNEVEKTIPLTFEADDGTQMVAIFTSAERAKPVVEKLERGMGISLNPGLELGIDMVPEMIDAVRT